MRVAVLLSLAVVAVSGCGRTAATAVPGGSPASVSAPRTERENGNGAAKAKGEKTRGPRALNGVPPGHYPKAGECRLWYSGKPPGQQPRPTACRSLMGRVPDGAFILYGGKAYDSQYDWAAQARRERGSVPDVVVEIIRSIR